MIDTYSRFTRVLAAACLLAIGAHLAHAQDTPAQPEPSAQSESTPPDARYASPEATMFTYLGAMADYKTSQDPADLDAALNAFNFANVTPRETRREIAANLLNILNRINLVERWQFAEPEGDRFVYFPQDWISAHAKIAAFVPGAGISLEKQDDATWRFDQDTIEGIPAFLRSIEDLHAQFGDGEITLTPSMWIRSRMPTELRHGEIVGIEYWQWIAIALLIFAGFIVDQIVRTILRNIWRRIAHRRGQGTSKEILGKAVRPFGIFAGALLWLAALPLLGLPPTAANILLIAVRVVLMLAGVWAAYRVTDLLADFLERQASKTNTKLDDLLIPLGRKTGKVLVTVFGLIYIAESFDVQILPLLTGLGIGGLAFAFAAKDTIENFFGSVAVILDQPFEVGDWVVIEGAEGTVEELGLRSTRIRTFYDSQITIPNSTLVRTRVDNYGRRRYRRFRATIGVTYATTPEQVEAFCEGIREIIRQHPYTRKDYFHVYLNSWGDFSLNILLYVFFDCADWAIELRERQRLMLDIMRLARRLGVGFAFPTQSLELSRASKQQIPGTLDADATPEENARRIGIETTRSMFERASWKQAKPGPVIYTPGYDPSTAPHISELDDGDGG